MDIVWSCTNIIILSTWSVLHLTVPPDLKPQSKRQQFRKQIYLLSRKLVWMGIMLAFPKYLVGLSTTNIFAPCINNPRLKELAREDSVPWSLAHTVLANIGGIAVRFSETSTQPRARKTNASLQELELVPSHTARTETHEVLGSKEYYKRKHIAPLHGNIWVLDSKQLALARGHGIISRLHHLEENEITDRSKSDGLVRLFALMQVLWLLVQLIVRSVEGIPFAALEVSTLAFSSCAIIIYLSEWTKPQDAGVPFYIDTDAVVTPEAFARIAEAAPISFLQSVIHQVFEDRYQKKHVDRMMILMSILSILLFGSLHLIAWNLHFPSAVERTLWCGSALTVAIAPTISALLVLLESVLASRTDRWFKWSVTVLGPLYLSARTFIMVESYRSLYYLPAEAFVLTWAANVPHVREKYQLL
ncbi:uncharacterized protein BDW70DRAFT_158878 [Aspergillus foveolatus]|uniref:uncharacterized protein n=1 Tax=Aspergillus foveolatus TaxID=210207 RepID=UPI003CCD6D8D